MLATIDIVFIAFFGLAIIQRLAELRYSRSNQKALQPKGFELRDESHNFKAMLLLHVSWFFAMLLEWYFGLIALPVWLRWTAVAVFFCAQAIRYWAIKSLGVHWNVQIMAPEKSDTLSMGGLTPEAMVSGKSNDAERALQENIFVEAGPYKYVRHPNYLAVILEMAALPIVGDSPLTALIWSVWNNHVLNKRIDAEEAWLFSRPGYHELFYHKSRFLPL